MTDSTRRTGSGYALGRLLHALDTAAQHPDPEVRARAERKTASWRRVLEGMASGDLSVGSRQATSAPVWVTLEVAHGGFATGRYLAETELTDAERAWLASAPPGATERERLNRRFLGDAGQAELLRALAEDRCVVEVPEHGALLTLALLMEAGEGAAALELLETIEPWLARLRFYPRLRDEGRPATSTVRVADAATVEARLRDAGTPLQIVRMKATLGTWGPLYDRLVALFCDTVEGELPSLDEAGQVRGGWPLRRLPADWVERRRTWLADFAQALERHGRGGRHLHRKSNFSRLRSVLERCRKDTSALTGRDVGVVRRALACTIARSGAVGSERRTALRAVQAEQAAQPAFASIAWVLADRLAKLPEGAGVPELAPFVAPVVPGESEQVPAETPIPPHLEAKVERALEAPLAELIERGVITSAETLALVLPQITKQVAAAGFDDRRMRSLYAQLYSAFRRRRSLLLLDYQHQVRMQELPWVAALLPFRSQGAEVAAQARAVLDEVVWTVWSAFPEQMTPNRLVSVLRGLLERAELKVTLVEEVAADIFMGSFTPKWTRAAKAAYALLEGSLYARYYDLPKASGGFAVRCRARSAEADSGGKSDVARNGAVIEQSQILTTQNLAALTAGLELAPRLRGVAVDWSRRALAWTVATLPPEGAPRDLARLRAVKNLAYAFRQALFFLSFASGQAQHEVAEDFFSDVTGTRLEPVAVGLLAVVLGERFDADGRIGPYGRRLLGWSIGPHPLLD